MFTKSLFKGKRCGKKRKLALSVHSYIIVCKQFLLVPKKKALSPPRPVPPGLYPESGQLHTFLGHAIASESVIRARA